MVDDVLIIGAGAAGLTAAYDLHWTEYNVKVLEASQVLGGRLRKNDDFTDVPLDLGAEWIHVNPSILDTIVDDPNYLPTSEIETFSDRQESGIYFPSNDRWEFETIHHTDYKFKDSTWFDFFNEWIAVDVEPFIEFGCQVAELRWQQDPVQAVCQNGDVHEAWHVIVTVPLSILYRGDIQFVPDLPSGRQRAIESAGKPKNLPNGIKTWIKFSQDFWTIASFMFEDDYQNRGVRFFYDAGFNKDTTDFVLGVYNEGTTTEQYSDVSDEEMIEDLLNDLGTMFGDVVRDSYTGEFLVQNWEKEEFIGGAYSMYHDGYWPLTRLRKSLGGQRLWFAGEAIPRRDYEHGFAHGAALSGRDTAAKVMQIYGDRRRHLNGIFTKEDEMVYNEEVEDEEDVDQDY